MKGKDDVDVQCSSSNEEYRNLVIKGVSVASNNIEEGKSRHGVREELRVNSDSLSFSL